MAAAVRTLRSPSLSARLRKDSKDSKDSVKDKDTSSPRLRKESSKDAKNRKDASESREAFRGKSSEAFHVHKEKEKEISRSSSYSGRLASLRPGRSASSSNVEASSPTAESPTKTVERHASVPAKPKADPVMANHLRVLLPNKQRTVLKCEAGVTLEQALQKALRRRNLTVDVVKAFKTWPKREMVPWTTELPALERQEIVVEDRMFSIERSHHFVHRGNMRITYCDVCRSLMVSGMYCSTCNTKVHQRCMENAGSCNPTLHRSHPASHKADKKPSPKSNNTSHMDELAASFENDPVLGPYFNTRSSRPEIVKVTLQGRGIASIYSSTGLSPSEQPELSESPEGDPFEGPNRRRSSQRRRSTMERWGSAPSLAITDSDATSQTVTTLAEEPTGIAETREGSVTSGSGQESSDRLTPASMRDTPSPVVVNVGIPVVSPPAAGQSPQSQSAFESSTLPFNIKPNLIKQFSEQQPRGQVHTQPYTTTTTNFDPDPMWVIKNDEVRIISRVGAGAHGTVYKAEWHGLVAVKKLHTSHPNREQIEVFHNEVSVLKNTRHSNILLFMGFILQPEMAIVTQWCEGSSLYQHLHVDCTRFKTMQLIVIAKQVSQGMDYLHARGIIHRDLKSPNVLLEHQGVGKGRAPTTINVKVADFGLSMLSSSGLNNKGQSMGSILWMAPEVIRMDVERPFGPYSDVYAFGIILFELMTSSLPYPDITCREQLLWMVGRGYLRPDLSEAKVRKDIPIKLRVLFESCVQFQRTERPLFTYILDELNITQDNLPKITRRNSMPNIRTGWI